MYVQTVPGVRPSVRPSARPSDVHVLYVVSDDFMMRRLTQRWTRALILSLFFSKDFIRNAQNSMCMQYFSADELTTGAICEMENTALKGTLETLLTKFFEHLTKWAFIYIHGGEV